MKKSTGSKIQDLEKAIIESMKATKLVEHPHFYHRNLNDPNEPITLAYKTAESYKKGSPRDNPFIHVFPLLEILESAYPGTVEIKPEYDEASNTYRIHMKIDNLIGTNDATQFKYNLLEKINKGLIKYLTEHQKRK